MRPESRQIEIYRLIKKSKEISIQALSEYFGVSSMTIRRDLDKLERSNLIYRTFGKVHICDETKSEYPFAQRETTNLDFKKKIAQSALKLIGDMESIYVDGSSTAYEFVKLLPPDKRLTIFTNSVAIIELLYNMQRKNFRIFVIGGFLSNNLHALDDNTSPNIIKRIFVDATFTSCAGFNADGSFNNGIVGSQILRTMFKNSSCNVLLADHTKYNAQGIFLLNSWEKINVLITDEPFETNAMNIIRNQNVKIIW
ncbi:DeoR/GlpR family DNA-binding transcription regulator [Diplocloster agilis]|uniref:DeoR/GlpR family DNA-binding transcription regulator n=1 Tax=Diplocloster agilis TaxID=2850323 RepID=UPI000821B592|nr:DeoR/GlpR family DNA-binding transcription regulator [Suonthocola fibrivorans]MCU6734392.1 DeoR/GlpR family DNA-binding transcription regulator [Suonthocola fibrivorans]SCJ37456.1 Glycerol-3-phosphate regulon repressor [uncultured Clostridium sp.]